MDQPGGTNPAENLMLRASNTPVTWARCRKQKRQAIDSAAALLRGSALSSSSSHALIAECRSHALIAEFSHDVKRSPFAPVQDPVHDLGTRGDHWAQFMPVDQLCRRRTVVPGQARDLLDRDAVR